MDSKEVFKEIKDLISADYPLLYVVTTEYGRVQQYIRSIAQRLDAKFYSWDCVSGLNQHLQKEEGGYDMKEVSGSDDEVGVLSGILNSLNDKETSEANDVYYLEDFHRFFDNPAIFTHLRKLAEKLRFYDKHIIIAGPFVKLPDELEKYVTVVNIPLPDRKDLGKLLNRVLGRDAAGRQNEIDEDLRKYFLDAALGMTDIEADLAFRLAKQKEGLDRKEATQVIAKEKEQIIKKSGILDYFQVTDGLEKSIGGLDSLKLWLRQRNKAFERKAKKFGLKEPKGMLLVGVPGCGKSLTAKCVAAEWKQPLLKLDIGKVFQAEVGSSENNIRQAIMTAEAVAPCVLWIDEIEKGLSTGGGEKDGGTNARVFSTILTWMQEKTKPVFVVATANNIQALPPELLRKGRFDEIFFVDLPTQAERENIFRIHLEKNKQTGISDYSSLVEKTKYFNGAEIEECVKEAMFIAYNENPDVSTISIKHLEQAIEPIVPLSTTMFKQINFLREFGKSKRARCASKELNDENFENKKTVAKTKKEQELEIFQYEE